ncbi:hypothetical protein IGI04_003304 [Brassica rapa subsp. trilocularis]|uniref:Pseudouridine synthase RsuA/RluA-like domain-containing protein n=1 Tax=Brassica rapa subsp. trilocularis TaxID=1813537 RepID=A0ABQ7NXZ4_BRACM|nr:hypothetical protein IGI04_003304 [Brassica rapa subsp. trilocularis]
MFVKETSCDNCTTGCDDSTIKSSHEKAAYGASARLQIVMIHLSEDISWSILDGTLKWQRHNESPSADANNGRSAAFKRQSGANHIIRSLRNASPAPIKATIDTIPCSIKESNPVILPNGVRNRNITEEHTPFKSTSSSDDLTELKKSKATENEPYQIFLCESISKKEIAVKKSANSMQLIFFFNKPHGMAVQGGTGVKASVDELYATTCLTFDKSESLRLVHRLDRDCSGLLVLGRTQTAATLFHCIFLKKTTVSQIPSFYFDDKFLLPTQMELNILLFFCYQGLHRPLSFGVSRSLRIFSQLWKLQKGSNLNLLVRNFRCVTCVSYLSSKVGSITEAPDGLRTFPDLFGKCLPLFLLEKLLQYEVGRRRVVEYPCSSCIWRRGGEQMVCMNYGEYANQKVRSLEAEYPTFLYAMPMTKTKMFFEVCFFSLSITIFTTRVPLLITWNPLRETCLPSKDVIMPIDLLKTKLMLRGKSIQGKKSVVPCQKNLAFGAAASMVHLSRNRLFSCEIFV